MKIIFILSLFLYPTLITSQNADSSITRPETPGYEVHYSSPTCKYYVSYDSVLATANFNTKECWGLKVESQGDTALLCLLYTSIGDKEVFTAKKSGKKFVIKRFNEGDKLTPYKTISIGYDEKSNDINLYYNINENIRNVKMKFVSTPDPLTGYYLFTLEDEENSKINNVCELLPVSNNTLMLLDYKNDQIDNSWFIKKGNTYTRIRYNALTFKAKTEHSVEVFNGGFRVKMQAQNGPAYYMHLFRRIR